MLLAQNTFAEYSNTYTKCIQRQKQLGAPLSSVVLALNMCERRNVSIYGSDNYLDVASNVRVI